MRRRETCWPAPAWSAAAIRFLRARLRCGARQAATSAHRPWSATATWPPTDPLALAVQSFVAAAPRRCYCQHAAYGRCARSSGGVGMSVEPAAYSFSRITTFEQCARRFRYRYLDKVKEAFDSVEGFMG